MNVFDHKNPLTLENQVIFLTGAAGQLGSNMVNGFFKMGSKVIATDSNIKKLKEYGIKNSWDPESVCLFQCDIANKKSVTVAFKKRKKEFGKITSLVANAGASVFEPFMERKESSIDLVMNVNLKGTIFCIQEFLKQANKKENNQSIVSIASHYGLVSPDPRIYKDGDRRNSEIYGASKAGIIQMTKYFAVHASELNVRVNAVSPGGIYNKENPQGIEFQKKYNYRTPMKRMGEPDEIVGAVIFLLSNAASYINGHNLVVDGGFSSW